jgi:hypothetical protein
MIEFHVLGKLRLVAPEGRDATKVGAQHFDDSLPPRAA